MANRIWKASLACGAAVVALATAGAASAQQRTFNIPAESAINSIPEFARQAGVQITAPDDRLVGVRTPAIKGQRDARQALRDLLAGTGLHIASDSGSVIVLKGGDKGAAPEVQTRAASDVTPIDEVVVTASKRSEKVREVAGSVTALTGDYLDEIGAKNFSDYLQQAPGVIFEASTPGVANVTIRGIGTATVFPDQGQSTTGVYVNDIPLTDPGFAVSVPDLDVFDVQRVEVLKGPQGTLFGSATLGGAVNYILNPVSLTSYQAHAEAGISTTSHASQVGKELELAVNLPLVEDKFGVRLTAIERYEPGYLDNIGIGRDNTNSRQVQNYRLSALWQISPSASLQYFLFYERDHNGDGFYAFPALGDLKRDTIVAETSTFKTLINNLKFQDDLGFATLTISGAISHKAQDSQADFTPYYGPPTVSPAYARDHSEIAEIRLASPSGRKLEWLVGGYYGRFNETYPTPTLQDNVDIFDFTVNYLSKEVAGFGEATYHLNDKWRVTAGGRYYDINVDTGTASGVPGTPYDLVQGSQHASGFSPKGSITFEPTSDLLAYALVSRGFRSGGVNLVPPLAGFETPATYGSDSLTNYEFGIRTSWLNRTLIFDSTFFYIDWSNIQIRLNRPDFRTYVANAASAHSAGLENSLTWRPSARFDLQGNLTYLDAHLSQALALGNGTTLLSGQTLPGASKWSTSETATYHFDLPHEPYLAVTHRYLSGASSDFLSGLPVGAYNTFALRAGLDFGQFGVTAFVENLTDKRGVTAAAYFGSDVTDFYIRPRTIGLRLNWKM